MDFNAFSNYGYFRLLHSRRVSFLLDLFWVHWPYENNGPSLSLGLLLFFPSVFTAPSNVL